MQKATGQLAHEFPLPGVLPIGLAHLFAAIGLLLRLCRGPLTRGQGALLAGAFGVCNWYLVWWLAAAVQDAWFQEGRPHFGELVGNMIYMLPLGLVFTLVGCSKVADARLHDRQRAGWTSLYFFTHFAAVAGVYLVSYKSPWTPAFAWLSAYLTAASLCWLLALPPWKQLRRCSG